MFIEGGVWGERTLKPLPCDYYKPASVRESAFCPLALLPHSGRRRVAVAAPRRREQRALLPLLGILRELLLDLLQTRHGPVDGGRAHQVEVVHAHQVEEEVAAEVAADDVRAAVIHEQYDGLVHLVVRYEAATQTTPQLYWMRNPSQ